MVTINNISVRSNVFETVYDLLKAHTFTTSTQPTVTASFIDRETAFQQVVVNPVIAEIQEVNYDRSSNLKNIVVVIDVYTINDPSNNKFGNKDRDVLSDDVSYLLESTNIQGISLVDSDESLAVPIDNNNKVYNKTLTFTYIRR